MAFSISSDLANAFADPERYGVVLLTFQLGSEVYGLWNGQGTRVYNTIPYHSGAQLVEVGDIDQRTDGSVTSWELKLSTAPDKGLTVDDFASFYDEDWQMGHVTVQLGMRHPQTDEIIGVVMIFAGFISEAPLLEGLDSQFISLHLLDESARLSETGAGYRNDATQKLLDDTDTSLVAIGNLSGPISKDLKWGQS